jgi:hypothetical protein
VAADARYFRRKVGRKYASAAVFPDLRFSKRRPNRIGGPGKTPLSKPFQAWLAELLACAPRLEERYEQGRHSKWECYDHQYRRHAGHFTRNSTPRNIFGFHDTLTFSTLSGNCVPYLEKKASFGVIYKSKFACYGGHSV